MKHPINDIQFNQPVFREYRPEIHVKLSIAEPPVVMLLTSYPPRECGIATYSQDLLAALKQQFDHSFELQVCALEAGFMDHQYPKEVTHTLREDNPDGYTALADKLNSDKRISLILIQHEFGLFRIDEEHTFVKFIQTLKKPIATVFHTVLPNPDKKRKAHVQGIGLFSNAIIVMTNSAANILKSQYAISPQKITVIPHGTHLVPHHDKEQLKQKFGLKGKKILSTFGLLSSGKGIETTLEALPQTITHHPDVVFLIIGKTHPGIIASEGEAYRDSLKAKVNNLKLQDHVFFINKYLSLKELLEYLQLTDIYLFTSRDPNQSVSGTFSYAMSCGCPIISTPIPHAKEFLDNETGIIIDFGNPDQLAEAIEQLLEDESLRNKFTLNGLERIAPTSWENSSIAHAKVFQRLITSKIELRYTLPEINLSHFSKLTDRFGMIQFSKINQPDPASGYTLDDNARAMIVSCMYYESTLDGASLVAIQTYLKFISFCQQPDGSFLNYVDQDHLFSDHNNETNLSDSNGRAIWALGYLVSKRHILPEGFGSMAKSLLEKALSTIESMHSPRSIAFTIKGLYFSNLKDKSPLITSYIQLLADRLIGIYRHESEENWWWFESYLTYANSILPEALLCAWKETGDQYYQMIAKKTFDFLLSLTFSKSGIKLISNKGWLHKGHKPEEFGEQPIDVAYTILALDHFYEVYGNDDYLKKLELAFSWFLGNNHLSRIIYNPGTGGCYDGLEREHINLNQGAESTVSYLIARMTIEKHLKNRKKAQSKKLYRLAQETF